MNYTLLAIWLVGGCIASTSYFPFRIAHRTMKEYDGHPTSYDPSEDADEYRFFGSLFIFVGLLVAVMGMLATHRFYP